MRLDEQVAYVEGGGICKRILLSFWRLFTIFLAITVSVKLSLFVLGAMSVIYGLIG